MMGILKRYRRLKAVTGEANAARDANDHNKLRELLDLARDGRYSADETAMILRASEGVMENGVPEAVVEILENRQQPKHARRFAAHTLGTMPCSASRDALRAAADGTDPDSGMADQARDALEALRRAA